MDQQSYLNRRLCSMPRHTPWPAKRLRPHCERFSERLRPRLRRRTGKSREVLGGSGAGAALGHAMGAGARRPRRPAVPLVQRRADEHLLQRHRPARTGRTRRAGGGDLRQPRHQHQAHHQLRRVAGRSGALRRSAALTWRGAGRSRDHLHADDARDVDRHVCVRAHRGGTLGGVRWLRATRVGGAHRRRAAESGAHGQLRH